MGTGQINDIKRIIRNTVGENLPEEKFVNELAERISLYFSHINKENADIINKQAQLIKEDERIKDFKLYCVQGKDVGGFSR